MKLTSTKSVTTKGDFFNVKVGLPQGLKILREPSNTWAGNQPFKVQPKVALVDAGGNILADASNMNMDAIVVESLSQTSDIIIDTRLDPVPVVDSVRFHSSILGDGRNAYSYGHNISIMVHFSQEVFVTAPSEVGESGVLVPTLTLNVIDDTGLHAKAYLSQPFDLDAPMPYLLFTYEVAVDSEQSLVDILDAGSLEANGYIIRDAWFRNTSLSLPSLDTAATLVTSKSISVHDGPASISEIRSTADDGEYGAGHVIDFEVDFTHEVSLPSTVLNISSNPSNYSIRFIKVAVDGSPQLPLRVKSNIALIDTVSLGTSLSTSYFYIWYKNERSESIPWDASAALVKIAVKKMQNVGGDVCVSRSRSILSYESGGFRWVIRFDGIYDDLQLGFSTESATVFHDHKAINSSTTFLVRDEALEDWTHDDGDETMCTYRHAEYLGGSGTDRLTFRYLSLPGDETSRLDLASPPFVRIETGVDLISNALNGAAPSTVHADLIWNGAFSNNIAINTAPPQIVNLVISGTADLDHTFHAGDVLSFHVVFDKPISVSDLDHAIRIKLKDGTSH